MRNRRLFGFTWQANLAITEMRQTFPSSAPFELMTISFLAVLLNQENSAAYEVLNTGGVNETKLRQAMEHYELDGSLSETQTETYLKRVMEAAMQQAIRHQHSRLGTLHLLLGILSLELTPEDSRFFILADINGENIRALAEERIKSRTEEE